MNLKDKFSDLKDSFLGLVFWDIIELQLHTFTEHNINTGSCPDCKGHSFERVGFKFVYPYIRLKNSQSWKTEPVWKCLNCGATIWGEITQ